MSETKYWLWLSSTEVSARSKAALIEYYGDAESVFRAPKGEFASVSGVSRKDAEELEKRDMSAVSTIFAR